MALAELAEAHRDGLRYAVDGDLLEAPVELPDNVRQQLKGLLGVDIDLRFIKTQCRVSQGNLDREVMSQIGYLKAELMRCGDTI